MFRKEPYKLSQYISCPFPEIYTYVRPFFLFILVHCPHSVLRLSPPLFPKTLTLKITSHFRGRGGFNKGQDLGPLEHVVLLGEFLHPCEDDTVCSCTTNEKMSYFNAPVDLQNKEQLGKVEEICGQLRDFCFSVKLSENIKASSFKKKNCRSSIQTQIN